MSAYFYVTVLFKQSESEYSTIITSLNNFRELTLLQLPTAPAPYQFFKNAHLLLCHR